MPNPRPIPPSLPCRLRPAACEALVLVGYSLLALLVTYPLSLAPAAYIPLIDAKQLIWGSWWVREALLHGVSPFYTPYLHYPEGVSLSFHTLAPLYGLVSVPLQALFGLIVAYNLVALLVFVSTGYAAYWLGRDVTGSRLAGFAAGVVLAFAPTQLFHFSIGQAQMHTITLLPVYVLCVRHWLAAGGLRWLLGSVIALALTSYVDWQLVVYLLLFTGLAALWQAGERRSAPEATRLAGRLALLGGLYTLSVAPVVWPMLQQLGQDAPHMLRSRTDTVLHSADVLGFLVPNPFHPLWGGWAQQQIDRLTRPGILNTTISLSYAALLLALVALRRAWHPARFWLLASLVFGVLALGPQLRVAGVTTTLPLPYELLGQISVLQVTRAPARYVIMLLVCLAVLAALGVHALQAQRGRLARVGLLVLLAGLAFEHAPARAWVQPLPPLPAFFADDTLRGAGALLEVPNPGNDGMYYQTFHTRPTLYGQTARDALPGRVGFHLRDGALIERDMFPDPRANWLCTLRFYDFTHLVHYTQRGNAAEQQRFAAAVAALVGPPERVQAGPVATLYALPAVDEAQPCLIVGEGWSAARPFGNSLPSYRWLGQQATLGLVQRDRQHVRLDFTAHAFAQPRTLALTAHGATLATLEVGTEPAPHTVTLTLPAGLTWLELRALEPATSPAEFGYNEEVPVSIGLSQVQVTALAPDR